MRKAIKIEDAVTDQVRQPVRNLRTILQGGRADLGDVLTANTYFPEASSPHHDGLPACRH